MKRIFVTLAVAATAVLFAVGPVTAAGNSEIWHRLNPDLSNPTAEHELLTCSRGGGSILCAYSKIATPGYHFDSTVGMFVGRDVTATWECPDWFPGDICENIVSVASGHARYWPSSAKSFQVDQDIIVADLGGQPVMFQYWVGQFACPWYATFQEALDANPGLGFDCVVP